MSNNFLKMMGRIQAFLSVPSCRVCGSRVCSRYGNCDENAQIDRAILSCASVCGSVPLADVQAAKSFAEMGWDAGQIYLVYKAGEILARKSGDHD